VRVSAEAKASALRRIEKRSSRRGASVMTTRQSRPFRRSPLITLWISACSARVRWVRPWSSRKGVRAAGGTVAATAWPPGLIRPQWVEVEGLPRFNLIHRPLSDFFPVYNEGRGRTHRPDAESGGHCKDDLLGGVFICAVRKRPNWHPESSACPASPRGKPEVSASRTRTGSLAALTCSRQRCRPSRDETPTLRGSTSGARTRSPTS
jgi:hypothetical protein